MTCSRILNVMVILGFMFNYMLRVNLTIAIIAMMQKNDTAIAATTNSSDTTAPDQDHLRTGPTFPWDETQKNDILGSFFWGYILTELPGGRLAEIVGARRVFGGGMMLASVLTLLTPAAAHLHFYAILILRAFLGCVTFYFRGLFSVLSRDSCKNTFGTSYCQGYGQKI